jgi:soluble lytic murein transglycosylase-like protein
LLATFPDDCAGICAASPTTDETSPTMQSALRTAFAFACVLSTTSLLSDNAWASASRTGQSQKAAYSDLIAQHARANGITVTLARAVVKHESGFKPNVTGLAGEIGLMQIKLSTARGMGYTGTAKGLYDPATNLRWGMKYLGQAQKLAGGSECGTLSRYNGGHGTKRMIRSYCGKVHLAKD